MGLTFRGLLDLETGRGGAYGSTSAKAVTGLNQKPPFMGGRLAPFRIRLSTQVPENHAAANRR